MTQSNKKHSEVEQAKDTSGYLRGQLNESLDTQLTAALVNESDTHLIKFHGIYQQYDRDSAKRRELKKLEPDYTFMLRLRIPGGGINAKQWLLISSLAQQYATGVIKVTTRQTVQLHGIIKHHLKPTVERFYTQGNLDSIAACGDVNRNVMVSNHPFSSAAERSVYQYAQKISEHLLPKTRAYHEIWLNEEKQQIPVGAAPETIEPLYLKHYLPRKFKIAIATPPNNDVDVFANDIGLIAIIRQQTLIGFNVAVGGGLSAIHGNEKTYPRLGSVIGYADKNSILDVCWQIVAIQRDWGDRSDRKQARLKYTVDRLGLAVFVQELEKRLGFKLAAAKDYHFDRRTEKFGWQQDYKGLWYYTIFVENGRVCDGEQVKLLSALNQIAQLNKTNFRFSANQNVILADIKSQDKTAIHELLKKNQVIEYTEHAASPLRKHAMACVALNTCPLALAEGQRYLPKLITLIEKLLIKHNLQDRHIVTRMTGCPNGCGRPYLAEIGLVGVSYGKYNLHLGGDALGERLNVKYRESLDEAQILNVLDDLFARYAASDKTQTFGDFAHQSIV